MAYRASSTRAHATGLVPRGPQPRLPRARSPTPPAGVPSFAVSEDEEESESEPPPRTLAEAFAAANPGRRSYDLGRAIPPGTFNPALVPALAQMINKAMLPQLAEFYARMQPVFETYIRTQMQAAGHVEAINRIVANAVNQFDGEDWDRLRRGLERAYHGDQDRTIDLDVHDAYQAMTSDEVRLEANVPAVGGEDWLVEWWRWLAGLLASLYFTATVSAQVEITKPDDLIAELRDNAVVAIAIYAALVSRGRKRGYK